MQRRYTTIGDQAVGADQSVLSILSATTIRPSVYFLVIGSAATPADQATKFALGRITAGGTSTPFTPIAHDPADPASLATCGYNHTAEPTYTASAWLLWASLNQQNTFKWETLPQYGLKIAASATAGIGLKSSTATGTAVHEATIYSAE